LIVETPEDNPIRRFPPFADAEGDCECAVAGTNVPAGV